MSIVTKRSPILSRSSTPWPQLQKMVSQVVKTELTKGFKHPDVNSFLDLLVNRKPWDSGLQELLTGSHIFVCDHSMRRKRSGICGSLLIDKFKEEIELKGLKDQVFVSGCYHLLDDKYPDDEYPAGNLIIFSADADGKIAGHWYGDVTRRDVPELPDQHIGKAKIIERLWRGQMRAPEKQKMVGSGKPFCCMTSEWEDKMIREFLIAVLVVKTVWEIVAVAYRFYKRSR